MLKKLLTKIGLSKSDEELLAIELVRKHLNEAQSIKATERNSTTLVSTAPEVWIMSGLVLSVVTQIVFVSRRDHN